MDYLQVLHQLLGECSFWFYNEAAFAFLVLLQLVMMWLNSRTSENRWLTIHTVCMGLLDSPETCDLKDPNMQISATESICKAMFTLTWEITRLYNHL